MNLFRKVSFITCALLIVLSSCNSSQKSSKKRRKKAPCDCPTFNYIPHSDHNAYKAYAFGGVNMTNTFDV